MGKNIKVKNESLYHYINELIYNKLKFKSELRGSSYLLSCIEIFIEKVRGCKLYKDIYPTVAEEFKTTPLRVERSIRYAIEVSWKNMDEDIKKQIFSHCLDTKPTNMECICSLYDYIQKDYFKNWLQENTTIMSFNAFKNDDITDKDEILEKYIYELIYSKLNFKHSGNGSIYLLFYIKKAIINNLQIYNLSATKDIYPMIATQFKTKQENVESAIRHAIEISWKGIDDNIKKQVFPIVKDNRPTNTEVIYALYEYVKANNPLYEKSENSKNIYDFRFKLQRLLEELYGIYSEFGINKLQVLTDSIMIAIEMGGVTEKEMEYIISNINEKYGLEFGTYELYDGYTQIDKITPLLYKMCNQIYMINNKDFPLPQNKEYIKSYLNILSKQLEKI